MKSPAITALTADFLAQLIAACEAATEARKAQIVADALGRLEPRRRRGRPRKLGLVR